MKNKLFSCVSKNIGNDSVIHLTQLGTFKQIFSPSAILIFHFIRLKMVRYNHQSILRPWVVLTEYPSRYRLCCITEFQNNLRTMKLIDSWYLSTLVCLKALLWSLLGLSRSLRPRKLLRFKRSSRLLSLNFLFPERNLLRPDYSRKTKRLRKTQRFWNIINENS